MENEAVLTPQEQREKRRQYKAYVSIRNGHAYSRLAYHIASQALIFGIATHFLWLREAFPFGMPVAIVYAIIATIFFVAYVYKRKIDTSLESQANYVRSKDPWLIDKVYRLFYTGPHNSLKYAVMGEWLLLAVATIIYNAIQPSFVIPTNLSWFVGVGVLVGLGGFVSKDRFFSKVFEHLVKSGMLVTGIATLISPRDVLRGVVEGAGVDAYERSMSANRFKIGEPAHQDCSVCIGKMSKALAQEVPVVVLKDVSHKLPVEEMYASWLSMRSGEK